MVIQVNGSHSFLGYRRALAPNGIFVMVGGSNPVPQLLKAILLGGLTSRTGSKKMGFMGIAKINQKDLELLKELLETGKVKPVIDRRYPLAETAEAFRYLGEGHARGKVVVTVEPNA